MYPEQREKLEPRPEYTTNRYDVEGNCQELFHVLPWLEGQLTLRGFKTAPVVSQGDLGLAVR